MRVCMRLSCCEPAALPKQDSEHEFRASTAELTAERSRKANTTFKTRRSFKHASLRPLPVSGAMTTNDDKAA